MEIPFSSIIYSILGGVVSATQAAQNGFVTGVTGVMGATAAHLAFANPVVTAVTGIAASIYVFSVSGDARDGACSLAGRTTSLAVDEVKDRGHAHGGAIALTGLAVGLMTGSIWIAFGALKVAEGVLDLQKYLT